MTGRNSASRRFSADALFIDREKTRERFITDILGRLKDGQSEPYSIKADNVEEAAAFVCASLHSQSDLSEVSLVVTDPGGWRFVEHNLTLKVAIAARPRDFRETYTSKRPHCDRFLMLPATWRGIIGGQPDVIVTLI